MPGLSTSNFADRRDSLPKHQATANCLVSGDLPNQPSQDRFVRAGLKRYLGVSYPTAWLIQHKLMEAMSERETNDTLSGQVQIDDAYFGGELSDGKAGRGSENKVPFVTALSLDEEGHPLRIKLTPVSGFTNRAIADWAKTNLTPGCAVLSDGLACFAAVTEAGCQHQAIIVGGRKPKDVPEFLWINTILGNLKTRLGGAFSRGRHRHWASPRRLASVS